jgi:hypothetical protein
VGWGEVVSDVGRPGMHSKFLPGNLKGRDLLGDIGVWGVSVKMDVKEIERVDMCWVQDWDQWHSPVNMITNGSMKRETSWSVVRYWLLRGRQYSM